MARRTTRAPRGAIRRRLSAWNARAFQPRQIILRSDDRVHALRLGRRLQQAGAMFGGLVLLWIVGSAGMLSWQADTLQGRRAELVRAERAYADLLAQVQRARADVVALATRIPANQLDPTAAAERDRAARTAGGPAAPAPGAGLPMAIGRLQAALDGLAERNGDLSDQLARAHTELRATAARNAELDRTRARLRRRLTATEQALSDARLNRTELHDRVTALRGALRAARSQRQASQQGRLQAETRVRDLERSLAEARDQLTSSKVRAATLAADLERSRAARGQLIDQRRKLAGKLTRLERALGEPRPADGDLASRIAGLEQALLAAERHGDQLADRRDRLQRRVAALEGTIESLRDRQSRLVASASARTLYGLEAIEKMVAMTGLDIDALVGRVAAAGVGTGGRFVPVSLVPVSTGPASVGTAGAAGAADGLRRLDRQMHRLVALQAALGALPLTAPVDSFWVSSTFGKRRDPYNGQWAMHEGLDLAATAGSPVLATAPGVVAFAGRKSGYGRTVELDHGYGITTRYAHLRSVRVERGERVGHRQTLGALGSSGRSTGPHVHYEVRVEGEAMDPSNFLKAGKHVFKG